MALALGLTLANATVDMKVQQLDADQVLTLFYASAAILEAMDSTSTSSRLLIISVTNYLFNMSFRPVQYESQFHK